MDDDKTVLNLRLPVAAVDDTVRRGGCYIVRYHKDSAQVLDVFYWSDSDVRYSHTHIDSDYPDLLSKRSNRDALKLYERDRSVIGYYGGVEASSLTHGETLKAPLLVVKNGERLTATVTDPNRNTDSSKNNDKAELKLIITGLTSKNSKEIALSPTVFNSFFGYDDVTTNAQGNYVYNIVLDDITTPGKHFADLFCSSGTDDLIPGEDITIQAVSYNNTEFTNVAYSAEQTTNSLFAYNDSGDGTAHISNIRHIENLDETVSGVAYDDTDLSYVKDSGFSTWIDAKQITDISWSVFTGEFIYGVDDNGFGDPKLTSAAYTFFPVSPAYTLNYEGDGHTVSDFVVDFAGDAGLFGIFTGGSVADLKLVDFSVDGVNAGALAGSANGASVTNVLAVNSSGAMNATVTGSASVGGLVGLLTGGTVTNSAAALVTESTAADAGGLVGKATDGAHITACYSGGHTADGNYTSDFNVVGALSAGGLVGDAGDAVVSYSYSTCSASGAAVGGFVGKADGADFSACYSTGLVFGTTEGAFAGTVSGVSFSDCMYYEIVNERAAGDKGFACISALSEGDDANITAFDDATELFIIFHGDENIPAVVYDGKLTRHYQGKYVMPTVSQLGATVGTDDFVSLHYGDWPSPETSTINTK